MRALPPERAEDQLWFKKALESGELGRTREVVPPAETEAIEAERGAILEAAIGPTVDFLPFNFLLLGARRGNPIVRVVVKRPSPDGAEVFGTGTGFLIGPSLLMTNHHVLESAESAALSTAQFKYELGVRGDEEQPDEWGLAPDVLFVTSPFEELDYTVVAVRPRNGQDPGEAYGSIPLRGSPAKVKEGEEVNIIQHPGGRRKEVVLRESTVTAFLEGGFIHYTADTLVGSSGAPVFNDQWDVVALHHRGVISVDAKGIPIFKDGQYVCEANEGMRISAIVERLRSDATPPEAQRMITPLLYD